MVLILGMTAPHRQYALVPASLSAGTNSQLRVTTTSPDDAHAILQTALMLANDSASRPASTPKSHGVLCANVVASAGRVVNIDGPIIQGVIVYPRSLNWLDDVIIFHLSSTTNTNIDRARKIASFLVYMTLLKL